MEGFFRARVRLGFHNARRCIIHWLTSNPNKPHQSRGPNNQKQMQVGGVSVRDSIYLCSVRNMDHITYSHSLRQQLFGSRWNSPSNKRPSNTVIYGTVRTPCLPGRERSGRYRLLFGLSRGPQPVSVRVRQPLEYRTRLAFRWANKAPLGGCHLFGDIPPSLQSCLSFSSASMDYRKIFSIYIYERRSSLLPIRLFESWVLMNIGELPSQKILISECATVEHPRNIPLVCSDALATIGKLQSGRLFLTW